MSYSFSTRAASKALVLAMVAVELDKVAASQLCHQADKQQALAAAESFVNLLPDDDSKDVAVNMNGSLSGNWSGSTLDRITGAAVSVYAGLADRPTPAA